MQYLPQTWLWLSSARTTLLKRRHSANVGLSSPLIQKISDKGIFNITIKSGQSSIPSGLNFEIVFLNASSPILDATPSGAESNATLDSPTADGAYCPLCN